jgi:TonB family protein
MIRRTPMARPGSALISPLVAAAIVSLAMTQAAGCATTEPDLTPADFDDSSAAAPRCGAQHYPLNARMNYERGVVVVLAQIDAAGAVTRAELSTPTPSAYLNDAAVIGARYCRFTTPPQSRRARLTFVFDLAGADAWLPLGHVRIGVQPSLQRDL